MKQDQERDCGWCYIVIFIFAFFFISIFLWLIIPKVRPMDPYCSIEYFYVPALNKSLNSRLNTTLNFMVRLYNPHKNRGIYYDDVHLSFSNNSNSSIANYMVPRFYQGHKKKSKKWGQVLPLNNQTVLPAVLPNGLAVFRLELKTQVRFTDLFLKTKRYGIEVGADVEVNGDGVKANKKGIMMKKSDSSSLKSHFLVCVLMNLLVFFVNC